MGKRERKRTEEGGDKKKKKKENDIVEFSDSRLPDDFAQWSQQHFTAPTKVQQRTWPLLLSGRSVLSVAPTGSGKTLAYLVPILLRLKGKSALTPRALVLAPTRELALQIHKECCKLRKVMGSRSLPVVGGQSKQTQTDKLHSKEYLIDLVVGTPGRVKDVVSTGDLNLSQVSALVFDEYDRMCALGFAEDVSFITSKVPKERQTIFTSATGEGDFRRKLVDAKLIDSNCVLEYVLCDGSESAEDAVSSQVSSNIEQVVHVCAEHKKPRKLMKFLAKVKATDAEEKKRQASRILVFCTKIKTVTFLLKFLLKEGVKVAAMHGKMKQAEREKVLGNFKAGKVTVLVATDVAGRGIHIKSLPYIVNYTFPASMSAYIHRIGRTGRGNSTGHAYSFFTANFKPLAKPLIQLLESCGQKIDPNLVNLTKD